MIDLERCKKVFEEFILDFDLGNPIIRQRYEHTYRVMDNCRQLALNLNLDEDEISLAMLIGLLHDIGRFKQLTEYNSVNDGDTFDHAEYGADILFKEGFIYKFVDKFDKLDVIEKSIRLHNKAVVDDNNVFVKIIRDADKLDIIYIMGFSKNDLNFYIEPVSSDVLEKLKNNEFVKYCDIKTTGDKVCIYLGYVFDLNYDFSYNYLVNNMLYEKMYKRLNGKENVFEAFQVVYNFLNERVILC